MAERRRHQISTCEPSSMTRLVGKRKKSIALSELRCIQATGFRHAGPLGRDQRLASEEEARLRRLERRVPAATSPRFANYDIHAFDIAAYRGERITRPIKEIRYRPLLAGCASYRRMTPICSDEIRVDRHARRWKPTQIAEAVSIACTTWPAMCENGLASREAAWIWSRSVPMNYCANFRSAAFQGQT